MLLGVALIWGIAGPVIKATEQEISPLLFLTYRFYLSSLIALIFFILNPPKITLTPLLIVFAVLNAPLSLLLVFYGFSQTSAITGTLLSATGPFVAGALGGIFLREHITRREKIGLLIAFCGTVFIILFSGNNHSNANTFAGNLSIFGSVILGFYAGILGKKLLRQGFSPLFLTNVSFLVGFLCLFPLLNPLSHLSLLNSVSLNAHLGVIYMALFSGTLAYWLWFKAIKTIEVSEASVFHYLQPLFAAPIAIIFLGEKLTPAFIIGALLIAVGVFISEVKK